MATHVYKCGCVMTALGVAPSALRQSFSVKLQQLYLSSYLKVAAYDTSVASPLASVYYGKQVHLVEGEHGTVHGLRVLALLHVMRLALNTAEVWEVRATCFDYFAECFSSKV